MKLIALSYSFKNGSRHISNSYFTFASESAFSTSGRILDGFRSSLTPMTLQALICTQDWLRCKHINIEADLEELSKLEEGTNYRHINHEAHLAITEY